MHDTTENSPRPGFGRVVSARHKGPLLCPEPPGTRHPGSQSHPSHLGPHSTQLDALNKRSLSAHTLTHRSPTPRCPHSGPLRDSRRPHLEVSAQRALGPTPGPGRSRDWWSGKCRPLPEPPPHTVLLQQREFLPCWAQGLRGKSARRRPSEDTPPSQGHQGGLPGGGEWYQVLKGKRVIKRRPRQSSGAPQGLHGACLVAGALANTC